MRKPSSFRLLRRCAITLASAGFIASIVASASGALAVSRVIVDPAIRDQSLRDRLTPRLVPIESELPGGAVAPAALSEARTGFDHLTNGFSVQGPAFDSLDEDSVVPLRSFNDNRFIFEEVERASDGLGPTYNAQSCRECHQNVVTGGASQVTEQRTGHLLGGRFFESLGGSLIHSRATHPDATERVAVGDDIRTFRMSTSTQGLGYVEAIANDTLQRLRDAQPFSMRGMAVIVPVLEAQSAPRLGRFGWKGQHASLESFAADAYLNEMGVTSPLFPLENTIGGGEYPTDYDSVPDPEDEGEDVQAFADFMRASKAPSGGRSRRWSGPASWCSRASAAPRATSRRSPPRRRARPSTAERSPCTRRLATGSFILTATSCCTTSAPETAFRSSRRIEYVGTANRIRTAPLWGLRTRNRLMHDGLSFTRQEAILRHAGQAAEVTRRYRALTSEQQQALMAFLDSL